MESLTVTYKSLEDGSPIYMDIFIPSPGTPSEPLKYPLVLYFHGGGFAVGDRSSWMPVWLRGKFFLSYKLHYDLVLIYVSLRQMPSERVYLCERGLSAPSSDNWASSLGRHPGRLCIRVLFLV